MRARSLSLSLSLSLWHSLAHSLSLSLSLTHSYSLSLALSLHLQDSEGVTGEQTTALMPGELGQSKVPPKPTTSSFLLLSSQELSDTKGYEP